MATFTLDPATLDALSSTLSGIHNDMQGMDRAASGYQGLLGGSDLEGELSHFCDHWHYGIGQLSDHMGSVVDRLNAASQTYNGSDQAIQAACQAGKP
jgi:hypothetical protein